MIVYVTTRFLKAAWGAMAVRFHWYFMGRSLPSDPVIPVTTSVADVLSVLNPLLMAPRGA